MKLQNVINGLKKGFELNKQYFAIAVNIDGCGTDEIMINHYSALDEKLEYISLPECDMDIDSDEDILDYYGEDVSEDENENHEKAYKLLFEDWDKCVNKWSDSVRKWFKEINKKFDTDFPS